MLFRKKEKNYIYGLAKQPPVEGPTIEKLTLDTGGSNWKHIYLTKIIYRGYKGSHVAKRDQINFI